MALTKDQKKVVEEVCSYDDAVELRPFEKGFLTSPKLVKKAGYAGPLFADLDENEFHQEFLDFEKAFTLKRDRLLFEKLSQEAKDFINERNSIKQSYAIQIQALEGEIEKLAGHLIKQRDCLEEEQFQKVSRLVPK